MVFCSNVPKIILAKYSTNLLLLSGIVSCTGFAERVAENVCGVVQVVVLWRAVNVALYHILVEG
jgi:hypothetical protein